ncbi:hypothetical protein FEV16_11230 [Methylocystis sp. B8]|nr:hypothetical protein FEV16_11230 [Methylocystis sp. B8]
MWKLEHGDAADRRSFRYPCDLIDDEWALIAPMIPLAKRGLMPDSECYATTVAAFLKLAIIRIMLKRLTRSTPCS